MTTTARIKVAVAGAGMVTRHHLRAWSRLPQVEVAAICARHLASAKSRAAEFNIPAAYDDLEAMLDHEKPAVLDIATPPEVHGTQAMMAADRGIHILCQKPMTPNLAESERLVDTIGSRVRFMVHENWRFRPHYRQAAVWISAGRIGRVREFQMTVRSSGLITRTPSGRLFAIERQPFFKGLPRFIIMELLIHHLDTVRCLVGPVHVTAASAVRVCPEVIGEDVALISLQADSGALGTVGGNLSSAGFPPLPADRLELIGDKASILFEDNTLRLRGGTEEAIAFDSAQAYQHSYDNAIAHFIQALQGQTPFETGPEDNLQTLRLVEAAYRKSGFSALPAAEKDAGSRHWAT